MINQAGSEKGCLVSDEHSQVSKLTMLRNVTILLAVTLVVLFVSSMLYVERSLIASKINNTHFDRRKVSEILPGAWDVVCGIDETSRPSLVLAQAGYSNLHFSKLGNNSRDILFDGETGLVLINLRELTYSLFLVFDRDRIAIIPTSTNGKRPCWTYSSATLVRNESSAANWLYLSLVGAEPRR
ncbi:hypothetical protein [Phyllobacterium chamaecytisi]|uniref:hypothetical protein n=1 Tax=Phyllobacterium chamaecytisi TaxID=2876082 RepID=UPI001CCDA6E2|nr:hypothetical protein [Phyllobacterium sp. KW56]MBZ9605026.1 hypothetical protein [Phyllobacterium sp. KW56]